MNKESRKKGRGFRAPIQPFWKIPEFLLSLQIFLLRLRGK